MTAATRIRYARSLIDVAGNTPLVELSRIGSGVPPLLLAKLEYLNPGGSVKDRIALRMVETAEREGRLRPRGTIVEPTSGNTGVGLAIVAQQKGYRCVFTCPDKVSQDKQNVLRALGARVVVCPAALPPEHPDSYRGVARRLAHDLTGACLLDQYSHPGNPLAHYHGTGPEIWSQTDGRITCLVAGIGTGGTITGAGRFLKEVSGGRVRIVGADPDGSVFGGASAPKPYLVEGVGQPVLPAIYDPAVPDEVVVVSDRDSFAMTRRLAREEGMLVGPSGGMAVAAALRAAVGMSKEDVVVVLLPDSGRGYLSKVYDDEWMQRHGFDLSGDASASDPGFAARATEIPYVTRSDTVGEAVRMMATHGLPALPVVTGPPPVRVAQVIGAVTDADVTAALLSGTAGYATPIAMVARPPLPTIGVGQSLEQAAIAMADSTAAMVLDAGILCAVLTLGHILNAAASGGGLPASVGHLLTGADRIPLRAEKGQS